MTVCSFQVTYAFQRESWLYSCLNFKELLARRRREIWSLGDCNWTWNQSDLVHKPTVNHLAKRASDWAVFWVLTCTVNLTVCSCHVTCAFQSESTLCSCLNVLGRRRPEIWSLSDCNWTRSQNHLVRKRTLNYLAKLEKWLTCVLSTYLYYAVNCMFFSCTHFRVNPDSIVSRLYRPFPLWCFFTFSS